MVDRQQVRSEPCVRIPDRPRDGLFVLIEMFRKRRIQKLHDRNVQAVQPEHRLAGLVPVIVPRHRRRDDEVPIVHRRALAVDGRMRAAAFEHEAQRTLRVSMCRRDFSRQHELHAGIQIGGDLRLPAESGIFENQHATLGFLGGDQLAGFHHRGANLRERPCGGLACAHGFRRDEVRQRHPERRQVLAADAFVEGKTLRRLGGRRRWLIRHGTLPERFDSIRLATCSIESSRKGGWPMRRRRTR